jgi:hypothetical protein
LAGTFTTLTINSNGGAGGNLGALLKNTTVNEAFLTSAGGIYGLKINYNGGENHRFVVYGNVLFDSLIGLQHFSSFYSSGTPAGYSLIGSLGSSGSSVAAVQNDGESAPKKISRVGDVANGVVASGNANAQTAANASVVTYTTANDAVAHTYSVHAYSAITAISAGTLTVQVSFTDENSNAQTLSFFGMGLTSAGLTATGFTDFAPGTIRAKANTAITILTTFTGVSITYDAGGAIELLY